MVRTLIEVSTSIVIAHKRSLGQGNVFTPVCDSVHKEGVSVQGGSLSRDGGRAGGTHPTGMHSC